MKVLVTGGGGFLGRYIVEKLVARGDKVRSLSRGFYPELELMGVETVRADLADSQAVVAACEGCESVFHVASLTGVWGDREEFQRTNVDGTAHVVGGCLRHGVKRLIYTSTPSVVWSPGDLVDADETASYPPKHICVYPDTKTVAEQMVLATNGAKGLMTCALRPHLIWGPRDTQLIPRILDRARKGQLAQVGSGKNMVDITYVENAAEAHLLAEERMFGKSPVAGKAYFITQGEPVNLWDWINDLLERVGLPPVRRKISHGMAHAVGAMMETYYRLRKRYDEPRMTRFLAHQLASTHTFSIENARRDFGYVPRVTTEEGLERLVEWIKAQNGGD